MEGNSAILTSRKQFLIVQNFNKGDSKLKEFFMSADRRIKIKLEKHELKVFHFGRRRKFFCEFCQSETKHLTVSQMSIMLATSEMNIFRLVDSKKIHSLETVDGKLMICADSIYINK